jgi:acyl-CoA thioester hydrolase
MSSAAMLPLWTEVVRVPFSDMDTLGHASHIAYFRYMQEARVAWVRSLAPRLPPNHAPVVVSASCSYLASLVYPANVEVEMTAGEAGRSSFTLLYAMRAVGADKVATGETSMVWFDLVAKRSAPLPELLRALFPARSG